MLPRNRFLEGLKDLPLNHRLDISMANFFNLEGLSVEQFFAELYNIILAKQPHVICVAGWQELLEEHVTALASNDWKSADKLLEDTHTSLHFLFELPLRETSFYISMDDVPAESYAFVKEQVNNGNQFRQRPIIFSVDDDDQQDRQYVHRKPKEKFDLVL